MKTFLRCLLKPLAFAPALFMILIIFNFSQQPGTQSSGLSTKISRGIVSVVDTLTDRNWDENTKEHYTQQIHFYVRKAAHITEYFILAITIVLPLYAVFGLRHIALIFVSALICVALAGADEYHQTFIAGRSGSVRDVFIDSIGIACGILTAQFICFLGRKTIFHPLEKEKKHN